MTLRILGLASLSFSAALSLIFTTTAVAENASTTVNGWSSLWTEETPLKGQVGLPEGYSPSDFDLSAGREPASTHPSLPKMKPSTLKRNRKSNLAQQVRKGAPELKVVAAPQGESEQGAQSPQRWPSSASDGFQFKVRHQSQTSAIWVLKREGRFDLVFATSGGSRINMTLPPEQFYALTNAASEVRSPASDMSKCKDSYVQVSVVSGGAQGKPVSACLDAKGKAADSLRQLGAVLTGYVR